MKGEALERFPAGKFRDFVFDGKAQGQVERSKADPGGNRLRVKFLAKKDIRERAFAVQIGVGIDEVAELFGLEAAAAVADPVVTSLQSAFLPRSAHIVIFQKSGIPQVEVDGKAIRLDVQEKRGGKIFVQFQSLKPLALSDVGGRNLLPSTGMGQRGLFPRQVNDVTKLDSGANMIDDLRGKVRIFFGVVEQ